MELSNQYCQNGVLKACFDKQHGMSQRSSEGVEGETMS